MAATTSQGKTFSLFIVAITVAAAGIAYFSTGGGKVALVVGLVGICASRSFPQTETVGRKDWNIYRSDSFETRRCSVRIGRMVNRNFWNPSFLERQRSACHHAHWSGGISDRRYRFTSCSSQEERNLEGLNSTNTFAEGQPN